MKITIINGNPKLKTGKFDKYLSKLSSSLKNNGNEVSMINLKNMKLNNCIGCYSCWVKTPGICIYKDDGPDILKQYINSDIVILSSPIIMGFISSSLKAMIERMIPLTHPYLYIHNDRMQHVQRYDKQPAFILLLEKENEDDESILITQSIFENIKTKKFIFTKTTDDKPEEVAHEINNI